MPKDVAALLESLLLFTRDCSSFSLRDRDTAPKAHTMNFHWVGLVIKGRFGTATAPLGTTAFRYLNAHSNLLNSM